MVEMKAAEFEKKVREMMKQQNVSRYIAVMMVGISTGAYPKGDIEVLPVNEKEITDTNSSKRATINSIMKGNET